jgi:hypothetical protein
MLWAVAAFLQRKTTRMARPDLGRDDIFVYRPTKQTLKAWDPFWDAQEIFFVLDQTEVGEGRTEWKVFWVAGVATLRIIGHVLAKVDGSSSAVHKAEINRLWGEWKDERAEHTIFWDFIEEERNSILKTYEFGAQLIEDDDGADIVFSDGDSAFGKFRDALYWWRTQLEELESKLP